MNNLFRLNLTKKKAKLRSYFSKKSSALAMLVVIGLFLASIVYMLVRPKQATSGTLEGAEDIFFGVLTFIILLLVLFMLILTNKRTLFFEEDSYYLFIGPYTNKQILTYSAFDLLIQSIATGLGITVFVYLVGGLMMDVNPLCYLVIALSASLCVYIVSLLVQSIYLKEMISNKKTFGKQLLAMLLFLSLVLVFVYAYINTEMNVREAVISTFTGNEFYYIPLFGWTKLMMDSFFSGNVLGMVLPFIGMSVLSLLLAIYYINIKGYFYEQSMVDAVEYSAYYKKAMAGIQDSGNKKIGSAKVKFGKYSKAILSKNWLILKKTKQLFQMNDVMSIVFVQVFGFTMKGGVFTYLGFTLLYLMSSIKSHALKDELKNNYTYLIPDKATKKMFYVLVIPVLRTLAFVFACLFIPLLIGKLTIVESAILFLILGSVSFILYAANIVSLKIMKSRDNILIQSSLQMGILLLFLLPSLLIGYLTYITTSDFSLVLRIAIPSIVILNMILSLITFKICSSMLNENALFEE